MANIDLHAMEETDDEDLMDAEQALVNLICEEVDGPTEARKAKVQHST